MEYQLSNLEASNNFAVDLAKQLLASKDDTTLLFYAGMGCGKTTLIRELGHALGIQGKITSPTFVGMNEYHLGSLDFYHYDLYQVGIVFEDFAEILESAKRKIVCIEWAEQLGQSIMLLIEKNTKVMKVKIDLDDETRIVQVN